jgi:type I restriction enzyme S subunit
MIEGPYKLPKGWRWVRLGEVCSKPQYGLTQSASTTPVGPKFLRITDITSGYIDWEKVPYCRISQHELDKYKLDEGDLLFARSGSIGATILIKEKPPYDAVFASYLIRVRLNKFLVYPEFLYWFTRSPLGQEQLIPRGATQKNINAKFIQSLLIPLPPLEEQKQIVARIEELMDRIKEAKKLRQETKKQTELLWQSVLAETFPQPGTQLPNGWLWVRLGDVARIFSGSPAPQDKRYFEEGSIPFVRVQDLGRYGITTNLTETSDKVNGEAVKELRLVKANKGTILFPKSGAAILTNSRAILGEDAYIVSHLAAVEPFYDVLETLWAFYWLCTVDMGRYIDNPAYPSLRLSKIRELLIPLPPLEEQKRIANYLQEVHEKIKELKEDQTKTEEEIKFLEQSILEKAFRGEL